MFRKGKTFKALILSMFLIIGSISSSIVFAEETKGAPNEAPVITEDNSVQEVEKIAETNEVSNNEAAETVTTTITTEKTEDSSVQEVEETAETNEVSQNEAAETVTDEKTEDVKPVKEIKGAAVETQAKAMQNQPVAKEKGSADKFYFEILPEIFENQNTDPPTLFAKAENTIGVGRNSHLYGGPITSPDVEKAWKNLAFNVYKEDGSLLERTTGKVGNNSRWGGAKYLGPYEKGHNYTVSVDTSSLPNGYYSYLSKDLPHSSYPADAMKINGYKVAEYDKSFTMDFASARISIDVVSLIYAKNEDVAKDKFDFDDKGQVKGWNSSFTINKDYILKSIDKDGNLVLPSLEEMEILADEGYKPNGFYFYRFYKEINADRKSRIMYEDLKKAIPFFENGYGYLKWYQDKKIINKLSYFNKSSMFTLILDQSIPKVTFDWNENGKDDPQNRTVLEVYYNKSLKNNSVSKDDKGLPKVLPKEPTKDGKVFAGWNTKQDGTGEAFTEDTVVTDDITVYAQWKDKEYTITVDPNGGNWNGDTAIKTQQFKENEEFTLPEAPTKDGYTFLYWKGSQYQPGQVYVVKEDHRFTAEWNKKPALEVKNTTIKVGDEIDLRTLIETAMDEEDGQNLIDKVLIDKGDFDSKKAGKYKVTFTLTDSNGASVTKEAIVTVAEKDKPTPKPDDNKPQEPNNKLFPQTGDSSNMTLYASLLVLSGALLAVVALRRRKES